MNIPDSSQLYRAVKNKKPLSKHFSRIDHNLLFIPEQLTQLYHLTSYSLLNEKQKRRYNQLFAIRAIEQLMTLEAFFIAMVLKKAKASPQIRQDKELLYCMSEMADEEVEHYSMFHSINNLAEPDIYNNSDFYFAKMTFFEKTALSILARLPGITVFLLCILMILEEFSTCISKQMTRNTHAELEPNFVKVHFEHLKDETRHVAICANLLTQYISKSSTVKLKANTFLLRLFMRDYMTPKRGGIRVIERLVEEFTELQPIKQQFISEIQAQKFDKVILDALQDRKLMPFSNKLFTEHPEFCFYQQLHV